MSEIKVRAATVDDVELLHRFSVDLATYEDEPHAVTSTPQTLARDGFGQDPQFAALIAERAHQIETVRRPLLNDARFAAHLTDVLVAVITAPSTTDG